MTPAKTKKGENVAVQRTISDRSFVEPPDPYGVEGDAPSAWLRKVFDEHASNVARGLRYLGVPESDLPDAIQEVFVVVARKHAELGSGHSLRGWLYAVATNVARNMRRSRRRRPEVATESLPEQASDATPDRALDVAERRALALRILDGLAEEQREVFVLHDVEELTMAEIASALGIPPKTGYSRLRLARAAVARAVGRARARGEVEP